MTDRIMAILALLALAGFLLTLVGFVPDIDLGIVVVGTICAAAFDFWRELWRK